MFLQGRFSTLTYSLVGDDNAQVLFRIDQSLGYIFVTSNGLFSDSEDLYRVSKHATKIYSS